MARKCEHRKQGRKPGDRYWVCLECGARIDGEVCCLAHVDAADRAQCSGTHIDGEACE